MEIIEAFDKKGNKVFLIGNLEFHTYEAARDYLDKIFISQQISELVKEKDKSLDLERQ